MRLGILGSMVWDRIEHPDGEPVERWGGISYSLAAAAAALPDGWTLRPLIKVGRDLAAPARTFLDSLPGLDHDGIIEVPEPNNRVRLRYLDRHHRRETLTGGVPAWRWEELEPRIQGLDGLYVNLISGFELALETARRLKSAARPVYADLHSLLLDLRPDGERVARPLEHRQEWLQAFDIVQVNEGELTLVVGEGDGRAMIRDALAHGTAAVLVTEGPEGARWHGRSADARPWEREPGAERDGRVPLDEGWRAGDPTGCGDVWGATCFIRLLEGRTLEAAMAAANRAAARNLAHRGAEGLYQHLRKAA